MEDMTVVCFSVDGEKCGKMRRWDDWQYFMQEDKVVCGKNLSVRKQAFSQEINRLQVTLPGRCRRKKAWTKASLEEYLCKMPQLPPEGRNVYYMPDEKAGRLMGRGTQALDYEWIQLLIACLAGRFDALIVLEERELDADRLVKEYARSTKYLAVVTGTPENWQDTVEELSEEYGMILEIADTVRSLGMQGLLRESRTGDGPAGKSKGRTLFVAGEELHGCVPALLPSGSVWLNIRMGETEGRRLCAHAKGVEYLTLNSLIKQRICI